MAAGGLAVGRGRQGDCAVTPWLSDPDVDIHVGDALEVLRRLRQLSLLADGSSY